MSNYSVTFGLYAINLETSQMIRVHPAHFDTWWGGMRQHNILLRKSNSGHIAF